MPHWKKAFPGKYLQVSDLEKPIVATITNVDIENVGDDGDRKLVVRFEEPDVKSLVLNQTRAEVISILASSTDYDDWSGTRIQVQRGWTRFQGKRVECIEVVAPSAPVTAAAMAVVKPGTPVTPAPVDDDDVAF